MKKFILFLLTISISVSLYAQQNSFALYLKTFGNKSNKPVIFLHGGPGYNCANFEAITAQALADKGFYVIVYDRRGEGRSSYNSIKYTFQQTFDDLEALYILLGLKKTTLIGHSFGGILATLFAEKNPKMVESIVLVGAPVSLQELFQHIRTQCKEIYTEKADSTNLSYISMLEHMDKNSLEYSSYCFAHAMQNGFYSPKELTSDAKLLYAELKTDSLKKYMSQMTYPAPKGFWTNEKYTSIDLHKNLQKLVKNKIPVYGLYGREDGLYSAEQIAKLKAIIGEKNVHYFEFCSHNVFIDQQKLFLDAMEEWVK